MTDVNLRRMACIAQHGGHWWPHNVDNCLGCNLSYLEVRFDNPRGESWVMEQSNSRDVVAPDGTKAQGTIVTVPFPSWLHYDR